MTRRCLIGDADLQGEPGASLRPGVPPDAANSHVAPRGVR